MVPSFSAKNVIPTYYICPRRQPIGFYICTGADPSSADPNPIKVYGVVEIFSLVLHVYVVCRIQVIIKFNN